jgi:ABC-type transport system involved in cytochrome c biogenesis permease subunit
MTGMALRLVTALLPALYVALASPAGSCSRGLRIGAAWVTVLLHAASFVAIHLETGVFPLAIPGAALGALALSVFVVYACVEWRSGVAGLRTVVVGAVIVLQVAATAIGFSSAGAPAPVGPLFVVHAVTTIPSVATLLLSGFFGAVHLAVERAMRLQRFGPRFSRLPNLSELAAMNRRSATVGFLLMTVGLNIGIWQVHATGRGGFSYADPMVIATMATWVVFGIIAASRWARFLNGRRAALTAVVGLLLIVATVTVSLVPGLSFHRFS